MNGSQALTIPPQAKVTVRILGVYDELGNLTLGARNPASSDLMHTIIADLDSGDPIQDLGMVVPGGCVLVESRLGAGDVEAEGGCSPKGPWCVESLVEADEEVERTGGSYCARDIKGDEGVGLQECKCELKWKRWCGRRLTACSTSTDVCVPAGVSGVRLSMGMMRWGSWRSRRTENALRPKSQGTSKTERMVWLFCSLME